MARASKASFRTSCAAVVITAVKDDLALRIQAGEVFERLALMLQMRGYSVAVHAALVEVGMANIAL